MPQGAPVPRAVSLLKTASYAKGCNFTKEVELVGGSNFAGNGDFADESDFAEHSNAAKEVCDSTNKNISGLNKRQCYKGSDATAMMATCHCDKVNPESPGKGVQAGSAISVFQFALVGPSLSIRGTGDQQGVPPPFHLALVGRALF